MLKVFLIVIAISFLSCNTLDAPRMERTPKFFRYHAELDLWCRLRREADYNVVPGNEIVDELECTDAYSAENAVVSYYDIGVMQRKIFLDELMCEKWKTSLPRKIEKHQTEQK